MKSFDGRGTWRLLSAEEANRHAPDTFLIPPRTAREGLCVGDLAKLLFEGTSAEGEVLVERMWVEVTGVVGTRYRGVLRNTPWLIGIAGGEVLDFVPEHIAAYASPARRAAS